MAPGSFFHIRDYFRNIQEDRIVDFPFCEVR